MNRFWQKILLLITILAILTNCESNSGDTNLTTTPTILPRVSWDEAASLSASRIAGFADSLSMTLELKRTYVYNDVSGSQQLGLSLLVRFVNISNQPLAFKEPITTAIGNPFSDLVMSIQSDNGSPQAFAYIESLPRNVLTASNFTIIEAGESYSVSHELPMPSVDNEGDGIYEKIAPGHYNMFARYANQSIGYSSISPLATPPPFSTVEQELEWFRSNTWTLDMNAWVGTLASNNLSFEVPMLDK